MKPSYFFIKYSWKDFTQEWKIGRRLFWVKKIVIFLFTLQTVEKPLQEDTWLSIQHSLDVEKRTVKIETQSKKCLEWCSIFPCLYRWSFSHPSSNVRHLSRICSKSSLQYAGNEIFFPCISTSSVLYLNITTQTHQRCVADARWMQEALAKFQSSSRNPRGKTCLCEPKFGNIPYSSHAQSAWLHHHPTQDTRIHSSWSRG